jgi:hypothetical protein
MQAHSVLVSALVNGRSACNQGVSDCEVARKTGSCACTNEDGR